MCVSMDLPDPTPLCMLFSLAAVAIVLTVSGYEAFPQECLQCCVTHSSPCRNTCRTVGVDPARIFFCQTGVGLLVKSFLGVAVVISKQT